MLKVITPRQQKSCGLQMTSAQYYINNINVCVTVTTIESISTPANGYCSILHRHRWETEQKKSQLIACVCNKWNGSFWIPLYPPNLSRPQVTNLRGCNAMFQLLIRSDLLLLMPACLPASWFQLSLCKRVRQTYDQRFEMQLIPDLTSNFCAEHSIDCSFNKHMW